MAFTFRLRPFLSWLFLQPARVYKVFGLPLLALGASALLPIDLELAVRLAGFAITIAGVWLVIGDIRDRAQKADKPTIRSRFRAWIGQFPSFFRQPQIVTGEAHTVLDGATMSASASVWLGTPPNPTPEQRIHVLEENLKGLRGQLDETTTRLFERATAHDVRLDTLATGFEDRLTRLRDRVDELYAGGIDIEMMGVVWVVAGTALCTFPDETARLISWVFK